MPPMKMTHAIDPKQDLMDKIGDLSEVEVFNNNILVAIYMRPNKTASGLYMPDDYVEQD